MKRNRIHKIICLLAVCLLTVGPSALAEGLRQGCGAVCCCNADRMPAHGEGVFGISADAAPCCGAGGQHTCHLSNSGAARPGDFLPAFPRSGNPENPPAAVLSIADAASRLRITAPGAVPIDPSARSAPPLYLKKSVLLI